jgi:hypothetical protein
MVRHARRVDARDDGNRKPPSVLRSATRLRKRRLSKPSPAARGRASSTQYRACSVTLPNAFIPVTLM